MVKVTKMDIGLEVNVFDPVLVILFWLGLVLLALWLVGLLFPTTRTRSNNHKNPLEK